MSNNEKILWPGWETVRLIGRGGFGSVYEIRRQIFNEVETAALKVISIPQNPSEITEMYNDGYDTESITETFRTHLKSIVSEYSLMRKMNGSANIVNCDDVRYIQHDDGIGWDIFIKMELLTPLAETLSSTISEATVVQIASDICEALVLCNKHEIIHRDIKPQNIFVSPNGDYKLGDFGIAKTVESTMSGTKVGTYKYMAPEVYNNQPYGSGADIYALGLVLYWLLNERRMPFMPPLPAKLTARVEEEARQRRFSGEEVPPPLHGSEKLKQIVLKACAYQPHERYVSAMDMLEDLDKLESDATLFPSGVVNTTDSMGLPNTTAQKNAVQEDRNTSRLIYSDVDNRYDNQVIEETIAVAKPPVNSEATVAVRKAKTNSAQKQHVSTAKTNKQVNGKKKKLVAIICVALAVIIAATFGILSFTHYSQSNDDNSGDASSSEQSQTVSSSNCKHIWNPITCTEPQTCSLCGETTGFADGHIWLEATYDEPETCYVCGETRGGPLSSGAVDNPTGTNVALNKPYTGGDVAVSSPTFSANLTDGKVSTVAAYDSSWYGLWYSKDSSTYSNNAPDGIATITVDLKNSFVINTLRVHLWNCNASGIATPESITAYISTDGANFYQVGQLVIPDSDDPAWASLAVNNYSAKYVMLSIKVGGTWTFLNEIEVYA